VYNNELHTDPVTGNCLLDLSKDEDNSSVGEYARAIIEHFPKFKSFNIQMFNKKAGAIKIDTVME
jgi:hypothetical protein